MPEAVAAVRAHDPGAGEPWILNDPYTGGTHLPDLTIVTRTTLGYAVTRAHHADVGGSEPGSLPSGSRILAEEGVVIPPTRLDSATLVRLVARCAIRTSAGAISAHSSQHTTRRTPDRELCAGGASTSRRDVELLAYSERVVRHLGFPTVATKRGCARSSWGLLELRAAVTIHETMIAIDFDGTASSNDGNMNCPSPTRFWVASSCGV
jgi:N-methylhydantoinase B